MVSAQNFTVTACSTPAQQEVKVDVQEHLKGIDLEQFYSELNYLIVFMH